AVEPTPESCPRPSRWRVIGGLLATIVLIVLAVVFGPRLWAGFAGAIPLRSTDTLIQVIDVFRCCILTWKAVTVMVPAFLLGGAIAAFAPTGLVLKYLGARAHQPRAYLTAAISGCVMSLCSCNIVPLFVSIYRRGAGIGPAFTFLFAGPAINIVAMVFTFQIIGWRLGVWRAIGVPIIAVIVGLLMTLMFHREARALRDAQAGAPVTDGHMEGRLWLLFALLLAMVLFGSWQSDVVFPPPGSEHPPAPWWPLALGLGLLTAALVALMQRSFTTDERQAFFAESWGLVKLVVPILLPAVLVIGAIATFIDVKLVYHLVGQAPEGSGLWGLFRPILFGSAFGELMYFPILTEVAFTKAFLKLGMDVGPALALLIAGPGSSFPGFIIVARAIGWKKAALYEVVVIIVTALYAAVFASKIGSYICSCMMQ
ncbi:MAG: permease, partial [Armatimonadetes bacterium]|nr:permease [Armatimonadota bacterium]